jgi:hypothetical protein
MADRTTYRFRTRLWRHSGDAAWHFVTLPHDLADEIDEFTAPMRRGFGSVRVTVTVGTTTWGTSLFPDSKLQSYVLPVKQPVRAAEGLEAGDMIAVALLIDPH